MAEYRRNHHPRAAEETPSVMTNSLASTLSTNFFGGGGGSSSTNRKPGGSSSTQTPQSQAATISKATATAISAARSIILTGGSHSSAIITARAAAYSILSPSHERKPGFLARRKCKQQAQVIANMAVVTVASAMEAPTNDYTLADPTVVFMEQQNRSMSKGTASTTDDLSWQKNFTRSAAESQPEAAAIVHPVQDEEEELGDTSFITCETPTSCNVSHHTASTPFGYFRNKQTRDNAPQMGRKMQLDIIESQDKSYESDDNSSYTGGSEENSTLCEDSTVDGSEGADTQDFTTVPTDYTDEEDRDDDEEEDRPDDKANPEEVDDDDSDSDSDDEDDDVVSPGRRSMVPAQLQTTNLFEDQILATLTDLCTPSNADAVSPPSSKRCGSPRTFAFETRDDLDAGELSDNTDGNDSSMIGSFFVANELNELHSLDAGRVVGGKSGAARSSAASQESGIEQVVLRALASSILPRVVGKHQVVDESLKPIEAQSQPTSPSHGTLPGTYIRNDLRSHIKQQQQQPPQRQEVDPTPRQRSVSESRAGSPRRSPRGRPDAEFVPAPSVRGGSTKKWFRSWKRPGRKAAF